MKKTYNCPLDIQTQMQSHWQKPIKYASTNKSIQGHKEIIILLRKGGPGKLYVAPIPTLRHVYLENSKTRHVMGTII